MSWDKNTVNLSKIDTIMDVLRDIGMASSLQSIGQVADQGIGASQYEKTNPIVLRRLEYKDHVYVEQMQRQEDCDADDHVISIENPQETPPLEITLHAWQDDGTCYDCGRTEEEI